MSILSSFGVSHQSLRVSSQRLLTWSKSPLFGWCFALLAALACHCLWQLHGIVRGGFQNQDVAGIAYNARLLLAGKLPYVDSLEVKPPGAFFLLAGPLWLADMKGVWTFSVLWGALTSLSVGLLAQGLWGGRWGPRLVLLHAGGAAVVGDGDVNYSFWMACPFTAAAACAVLSARAPTAFARRVFAFVAGLLAMFAVLIKPSAATLVIPLSALGVSLLWTQGKRACLNFAISGGLGAIAAFSLAALPFAWRGETSALFEGLARSRAFGAEYVSLVINGAGSHALAWFEGSRCVPDQLPINVALGALGLTALLPWPRGVPRGSSFPWFFLLSAYLGIGMTLRFYSHDNAQLWPALALVAGHPRGVLGRFLEWLELRPPFVPVAALLVGLYPSLWSFRGVFGLQRYLHDLDSVVAEFCERLAPTLPPGEPVLAWGWNAWSVYEHCGRPAPGPIYKDLASVTTVNTNTCNHGYGRIYLRSGSETQAYVDAFVTRPPALVMWSTYYISMGGDPLDDWPELRELVDNHYSVAEARGPFVALLRNDLVAARSVAASPAVMGLGLGAAPGSAK